MSVRRAVQLLLGITAINAVIFVGGLLLGDVFLGIMLALVSLAAAAFIVTSGYAVFSGAPFVPTDKRNVDEMIRMSGIRAGDHAVDCGSGDGRILIAAAKAGATAEGWEVNPWLWLISRRNVRRAGVRDAVTVHLGSYWPEDLSRADAVFLFLITQKMPRMETKLRTELRHGARVVSYVFRFPEWPHAEHNGTGVYLYLNERV